MSGVRFPHGGGHNVKYICGPSILSFPGGEPIQPGDAFEHDFSIEGPEGEHGPAREAALIAAEAIAVAPPLPPVVQVADVAPPQSEPVVECVASTVSVDAVVDDVRPVRRRAEKKE